MKNEHFYRLSSKLSSSTVQAHAIDLNMSKSENSEFYDQHMLILGEYSGISFPVIFKQQYGKKLQDILDTGWAGLYLISDNMKSVLKDNKITGWKTFSVKVLDKKGNDIEGYYGLSITGRCGPIEYNKGEIIERRFAENGPLVKYYKGLYIGLYKWDGSDLFLPEYYYGTIVTEKVARILKKHKISNIRLRNLAEIEIDESTVKAALQKAKGEK